MDLPIDVDPPTIEEISMAIIQIKRGKAAGSDNIPAEALKADVAVTAKTLNIFFNRIWDEEQVPADWINLPKKSDLSKVLLNRMKESVNTQIRDQRAGFRKHRSCTDQIATLRIIVEQSIKWNSSHYINFIEYEKAFDSVNRTTLWKFLQHYGVPEKIFNIIRNSYDGLHCEIVHGGQLTEEEQRTPYAEKWRQT
ncbi:unnamed protein product [Schistosoma curassoni]|uniref:Reverse transcriptase domain-containing protein n=1 Tax=Schistosoma curassoni TaxID=6186 RepID=A0A183KXM0_9TREM|nr:unnamed protein product [Schistosoma curassoni]